MNEYAPPQANEAQENARQEKARLARSFLEVFGSPNQRSESQKLVLAHLELDASDNTNAFQFVGGSDGMCVALQAAQKDGAQSRLRIIHRQISFALEPALKSKPVGKVKRS